MKLFQSLILRVATFVFGSLVTVLPRKVELLFGKYIGKIIYLVGYRKNVSLKNIQNCFPELGKNEHLNLYKKNYEHLGVLLLELLHFFSPVKAHYKNYVLKNSVFKGIDNWKAVQAKGKGAIFITSHLGNWEIMVAAGALQGIPITMITKHLKPEWLHQKITGARASVGIKAAYEPRTLPAIMRALRANEAIGFVMDQYAGPPIGIPVKFFGVEVSTLAAVGTLLSRTNTAVLPVVSYRDSSGILHVEIEPEIEVGNFLLEGDQSNRADIQKTTQFLASHVESWVRKFPEQWLWTHRRFKNVVWPSDLS